MPFPTKATERFLGISPRTKAEKVLQVLLFSMIVCMSVSGKLWLPVARDFPIIPVFHFLDPLPVWIHYILNGLAFSLLVLATSHKFRQQAIIRFFLALILCSLLLDQLRLQPWVFYYSMMLLAFTIYPVNKEKKTLNLIRITMILIYIWSGIQKINTSFIHETVPWLIAPLLTIPETFPKELFLLFAVLEIALGSALAFPKTRKTAVLGSIFMHALILFLLGPPGHNFNEVIWPWNLSFIILLLLLFWNEYDLTFQSLFGNIGTPAKGTYLLIFGVLPGLSIPGLWPKSLSSALYSGNKIRAELFISDEFKKTLPTSVQEKVEPTENRIRLNNWVMEELKVAVYPSDRFAKRTFRKLCEESTDPHLIIMVIESEPHPLTGVRDQTTLFCSDPTEKP